MDLEDIPPTADWLAEVKAGIEAAETFVFVISPDSIGSEVCQTEVAHAAGLNKRIVPVVRGDVDERLVPEPLAKRNWIFCRDDEEFDSGVTALNDALDTDLDWLHAHAELLRRALAWERGGRRASALLRGTELGEAEAWLGSGAGGGQQPTAAHREFILASRRAAGRRQRSFLAAVSVALVIAIGLAILALTQRSAAIENQKRAESQQLAAVANSQLRVDPERSLLLALQALDRSETGAARESLKRALGASRVRATLIGRDNAIFSPDGRTLTTIAEGNAYLWDAKSWKLLAVSRGKPFSFAEPAVYSPDGTMVAIGENHQDRILDARTGRELSRIPGAVGLAFSNDSSLLAAGAFRSGVIWIWDPWTGKRLRTLRGHPQWAIWLAWAPGKHLASASIDGTARIWSVEGRGGNVKGSGRSVVLRGHNGRLTDIEYSPDGEVIATASEDGSARLWDASSGAELAVLRSGRHGKVESVDFSPDGSLVVVPQGDGTVQIWSSEGRLVRSLRGHRGEVRSAKFSPDGRLVASAGGFQDQTARLWNVRNGRTVAVLRGHRDAIKRVDFSPDGSLLATVSLDMTARVWSVSSGEDAVSLPGGGDAEVTALAAAPAGRVIATGDTHGNIRLWNAMSGAPVAALNAGRSAIRSLAFAPDGKALVAAGDSSQARIYALAGDGSARVLRGHVGPINAVAVDGASDRVLTAAQDGTVRLWGLDGSPERVLGGEGGEGQGDDEGSAAVRTAAFDPAGERVIAGYDDGVARIWDAGSGRLERSLPAHDGLITRVGFSPDGELAVTAGDDGRAVVWNAASGERIAVLQGHAGAVNDARFSPDGESVVTASDDGTARVWDARSGEQLQLLSSHEGPRGETWRVITASFDRDGELVLTGGLDGTARVWEARSGEPVATLDGPGRFVATAEFTPDGAVAIGAEDSETALLYSCELCLTPAALRELAEERVTRELTAAERTEFLDGGR